MQVKICGITKQEDAMLCTDLGANALGFLFYERSKRYISPAAAAEIIKNLPPFISSIGVFVDESYDSVNEIAELTGISAVQLHGKESQNYIQNINVPVIKGFRVGNDFNWNDLMLYKNCKILLDSFSVDEMGGTGKSFNWTNIPGELRNKIILSGGISIQNIDFVFNEIKPAAVDISSSLESQPGIKDHKKVKEFFKIINQLRGNKC